MASTAGFATPDVRRELVYIYGLADQSGEIRYVGRSVSPLCRLWAHLGKQTMPAVRDWVAELRRQNDQPALVILHEVAPGEDAGPAELYFIKLMNRCGRLLNVRGACRRRALVS